MAKNKYRTDKPFDKLTNNKSEESSNENTSEVESENTITDQKTEDMEGTMDKRFKDEFYYKSNFYVHEMNIPP